jgi:hypothetical protein
MPRSRAEEGPPKASTTKCGQCHTCLNPQLKKACITFRKEQGLPPPTRKKKDGDAAVTATPAAAGPLGDDTTASEGNEQTKRVYAPRVDHWAAEKGWKPRKWRKVDVHNGTLLHNNTCKLKRWAPGGCQISLDLDLDFRVWVADRSPERAEEYLDRLDKLRKGKNAPMTESQLSVAAAAAAAAAVMPRTGHRVRTSQRGASGRLPSGEKFTEALPCSRRWVCPSSGGEVTRAGRASRVAHLCLLAVSGWVKRGPTRHPATCSAATLSLVRMTGAARCVSHAPFVLVGVAAHRTNTMTLLRSTDVRG